MTRRKNESGTQSMPRPPRRIGRLDVISTQTLDGVQVPEVSMRSAFESAMADVFDDLTSDLERLGTEEAGKVFPQTRGVTLEVALHSHVDREAKQLTVTLDLTLKTRLARDRIEQVRVVDGRWVPTRWCLEEAPKPGPTPTLNRITELSGGAAPVKTFDATRTTKPKPLAKVKPPAGVTGGAKPRRPAPLGPSKKGEKKVDAKSAVKKHRVPVAAIEPDPKAVEDETPVFPGMQFNA